LAKYFLTGIFTLKRIVIDGGSYNPVHDAHIFMKDEIREHTGASAVRQKLTILQKCVASSLADTDIIPRID